MGGVNKVILVGRLGRDPEMRYFQDGTALANFSIATSDEWKDKNTGEKREKTEWHRIVAFRRLGEICGQYLSKGKQVYVEGKLQTRDWEDKDGVKRYTTEIVASNMQMLDSKRDMDSTRPQGDPGPSLSNAPPEYSGSDSGYNDYRQEDPQPGPSEGVKDDDIPF